jgi:hypothetical protein
VSFDHQILTAGEDRTRLVPELPDTDRFHCSNPFMATNVATTR